MNEVKNKREGSDIKNPISIDNNIPVEKLNKNNIF